MIFYLPVSQCRSQICALAPISLFIFTTIIDRYTPQYIVLEETQRAMIKVQAGRRAMAYDERIRNEKDNDILKECWKQVARETTGNIFKETHTLFKKSKGKDC